MVERPIQPGDIVDAAGTSGTVRVRAVLKQAASDTPGVAPEPALVLLLTGYGDSALNFVVKAWTADIGRWMTVRGELLSRTLAALQAADIAIPCQQIDITPRTPPTE